jgi:hypothetical protein
MKTNFRGQTVIFAVIPLYGNEPFSDDRVGDENGSRNVELE